MARGRIRKGDAYSPSCVDLELFSAILAPEQWKDNHWVRVHVVSLLFMQSNGLRGALFMSVGFHRGGGALFAGHGRSKPDMRISNLVLVYTS